MKDMFCFQCQQTAHNTGCEGKAGVCGKKADTAKEIADQLKIEDDGFEIKFLGSSVADTVSKKLLYREDLSEDAKEVAEIDFSRAGTYYVEYTSTHFAFKNLKLIRTIFVTGVEENG